MNQLSLKGYVHNVTTTTQSRSGSTNYFNFSLQISDTRKRRAVCYDSSKETLLKDYQHSKKPITLLNITEKPSLLDASEQNLIVGKRSRIEPLNNEELTFQYDDTIVPDNQPALTTIENVRLLNENDLVTVKGIVTLETDSIREVMMKNDFLIPMLNRCTITDQSDTIRLTLWGDLIKEVANKKSYCITHVCVKEYDSTKYLTTTPSTTVTPTDEHFPPPTNEFFDSMFEGKTILVDQIRLADTFKTWLSCTNCQNLVAEAASVTESILKCPNCNAFQEASSCLTNASIRIAVRDSKYELIWLKVFTPLLQEMLTQISKDATIHSSEDDVIKQLFQLRNFAVHYSNNSDIVNSIDFDASDNKGSN